MSAVPVADPRQRKSERDLNFKPIPSPIFPIEYEPEPSTYDEVTPGHFVLRGNWGGFDRDETVVTAEARDRAGKDTSASSKENILHD
ncbi:MAG: hypothetical protein AAFY31_17130, partial [Pseudomonadota bacterium]